jgi:hypothetical protein
MSRMDRIVAAVCIPVFLGLFASLVVMQGLGMAFVSALLIGGGAVIGTPIGRGRVKRR